MILNDRKKCPAHCKCKKHRHKIERFDGETYDPTADVNAPATLEEHFENFADGVAEVTENFLGLGKRARARREQRQELKREKKEAKISIKQARAENIRAKAQARLLGDKQATTPEQQQQAQTQADQVNQLAQAVQPSAKPVTAQQTPTGGGGGSEELYKTLPMPSEEQAPAQAPTPSQESAKGETEATTEAPAPKKNKTFIYVAILLAVLGAWYFFKKKK